MIACIRIPYFATTLFRFSHPDLTEKPLILAQYKGRRGLVYAACETALQCDVKPKMAVGRARALCPEAVIEMASPTGVRRAMEGLLHILSDYSQWIEAKKSVSQTAIIYADIGKLIPADGQDIACQIVERIQAQGFNASVGLASGKFTAYVAAAITPPGEITLVKKGAEATYLAPISTAYLPLDPETARRFDLLGLRRVGQVMQLPRVAMIEQFGKSGGQIHKLACGEDNRSVAKYVALVNKTVSRQFEPPVADRLILESVLATLVSSISDQLLTEGMACNSLLLSVRLENRSEQVVEKVLHEPLSSKGPIYRAIQPLLDRFHIHCAITEISLRVGKLAPLQPRQLSLFDQPQAAALENDLIRLADLYGDNCFYRVEVFSHPSGLPELQYHLQAVAAA